MHRAYASVIFQRFFLFPCRSEKMGPLLRTEYAETIFLLQLSLCLSLSHYKDLKRRLFRWSAGNFTRSRVVSAAAPVCASSTEEGNQAQVSLDSATDDSLGDAMSPEDVDVEVEDAPSLMTVGLIREEWGSLFVETCKLVYALYGQSENGDDILHPAVNMSLLYDLLSDVILTPLRTDDNLYSGRAMQITCRRHALQLAMLSLDLPSHTKSQDAVNSSEVPLILEKLLARDGVKILCGLLEEYFAEAAVVQDEDNHTAHVAPVVILCPILVLLNRLTTSSPEGRAELKALIFPNPWRSEEDQGDEADPNFLQQKMDPTDIPVGTLRAHLIGLMTSLDSVLKRYCAELLYSLCDKESGEFVTRTGFGNAVALMQIKGLI